MLRISMRKAVIFDFDGTIADSFEATLRIGNRLAAEYDYRPVAREDVERLRGCSYREIAAHLGIAWHRIPRVAVRIHREMSERLGELEPIVGLPAVLAELRGRGFTLGILTSNSRSNVERFLAAHKLDGFDFIGAAVNIWGKQRSLKNLLKARRLAAHEVVYVGDEVRDIEATRALTVPMIAVGWGYTTTQYLAAHQPDHLIDRPEQLLEILIQSAGHG
jgi:phosphoglycolate phosphatase